jgi:hypothetical protein
MPGNKLRWILLLLGVGAMWGPTNVVEGQSCIPECRKGYVCHRGECVSVCNPPCAQGEVCTAEGECVATQAAPPPQYVAPYGQSISRHDILLNERRDLSATMPSVTGPAVMLGVGGGLLIAGGLAFGLSEWNYDSFDYWYGPGQYAGVTAMGIGGILVLTAVPLLAVNLSRRNSKKERIREIDRELNLSMVPVFSPRADGGRYGLQLRGTF